MESTKMLKLNIHLLFILSQILNTINCNFNVYLNESETRRLLGVPGELYYVKDGFINDYALSFTIPIKNEVTDIYFGWINQLPEVQLHYDIHISISDLHAMYQPIASIPLSGLVPPRKSSFNVKLPCTGLLSTDVDINISFNITEISNDNKESVNKYKFEVRRKKPCLRGIHQMKPTNPPQIQSIDIPSKSFQTKKHSGDLKQENELANEITAWSMTSSPAFFIGIGCALGVVVVVGVVIVMSCLLCRRFRPKDERKKPKPGKTVDCVARDRLDFFAYEESRDPLVTPTGMDTLLHSKSLTSPSDINGVLQGPQLVHPAPHSPLEFPLLQDLRVEPCRLTLTEIVMQGSFSCVCRGNLITGLEGVEERAVFVKMIITDGGSSSSRLERFVREGTSLNGVQHDNINSIIGACCINNYTGVCNISNANCANLLVANNFNRPLLIYPYMSEGNLKIFLQNRKQTGCLLSFEQSMCLIIQLAAAIQFLHRSGFVHKDIAARNCWVDSCMTLRLADSALSRDLFPGDYDSTGCYSNPGAFESESRPCKWMAVESLADDIYSKSSDVWSFAITIWELMTLGQAPYCQVDNTQLLLYLRNGYRLPQPPICPNTLYTILNDCWLIDPMVRPEVGHLQTSLHNLCMSLVRRK